MTTAPSTAGRRFYMCRECGAKLGKEAYIMLPAKVKGGRYICINDSERLMTKGDRERGLLPTATLREFISNYSKVIQPPTSISQSKRIRELEEMVKDLTHQLAQLNGVAR